MARKQAIATGLLPDGRAVRVTKITAPVMREIAVRASKRFPKEYEPTRAELSTASEELMIILCVKGITPGPVKLLMRKRDANDAEKEAARKAGQPEPTEIEEVDVDATLAPYIDPAKPEFKSWVPLGEQQLGNMSDENDLCWNVLFEAPPMYMAVLAHIGDHSGGMGSNPFAGKLVKTSST